METLADVDDVLQVILADDVDDILQVILADVTVVLQVILVDHSLKVTLTDRCWLSCTGNIEYEHYVRQVTLTDLFKSNIDRYWLYSTVSETTGNMDLCWLCF